MSSNDRKKQRHEQKRRQKRAAQRRADQGGSPFKRIGDAGSVAACYINDNWREEGIAGIRVLFRVPGGGHALAAFLIDHWCLGLKDAFGRLDISAQQFEESIQMAAADGVESVPISLDAVRKMVAGAIRWSREHNFRLPPHYERWTALLGDIGDESTADISGFGVDGKLHYVGTLGDLQRRLIGTTVDQFLARPDVEFVSTIPPSDLDDAELVGDDPAGWLEDDDADVPDNAESMGDENVALVERAVHGFQESTLDAVRKWCFANSIQPHPRLNDAVVIMLTGLLAAPPTIGEDIDQGAAVVKSNVDRLLSLETAQSQAELRDAIAQVSRFMKCYNTSEELCAALGLPSPEDEGSKDADQTGNR